MNNNNHSNLKLVVVVVSATNLMAKDGQGSSSSFVELHLENQRFVTTVKEKDLNPVWNETFHFNIPDPHLLPELQLEAYVYNTTRRAIPNSKSFLGKVRIAGASFVPFPDAVVMHYPLEKRSIFSTVKGELNLKVFLLANNNHDYSGNDQGDVVGRSFSSTPTTHGGRTTHPSPAHRVHQKHVPVVSDSNISRSIPKHSYEHQQHHQQQQKQQQQQHSYMVGEQLLRTPPPRTPPPRTPPPRTPPPRTPPPLPMYNTSVDETTRNNHSFLGRMSYSHQQQQPVDYYSPKETSPFVGGGRVVGGRVIPAGGAADQRKTYDLVEPMEYLFVRVVKARDLPAMDITGSLDPYVEVRVGNYKGKTRVFDKEKYPEWNEVFAFSREKIQSHFVEISVKDKDLIVDDFVGIVRIDLNDVPFRVPPDSPLAPEWYRLEDKRGKKGEEGELMLAVWIGTQADESFPDSWHSDAATSNSSSSSSMDGSHIHSKVYHSPRLWYVRVKIIEAQDLVLGGGDGGGGGSVFARAQIDHQIIETRTVQSVTSNAVWNDELMFVAAEPFEDYLIVTVQDRVGKNKDELIGRVQIPLQSIDKRIDEQIVHSRWFNMDKHVEFVDDGNSMKKKSRERFSSRIHLRLCLDGGYHVFDDSTHHSSDLRPTAKQLWKPPIGVLELGILNAGGLLPTKQREGRGTSDTYCVAKYGQKWVRTRTIVDNLTPKYNEQYTWEVFDPATVLTVGVFDNHQIGGDKKSDDDKSNNNNHKKKDLNIGKVRIRLSTLQTGRVYTHSYPLLVLHPSGVKKMGELQLAIRFSSSSLVDMLHIYSRPLLPKMHYVQPLSLMQLDFLKQQAVKIVAAKLSRMEPPLRKEVIEYMSDSDSHLWSMRKSKANFFRLVSIFSSFISIGKWFGGVCLWSNPITTVLVHVLFLIFVCFPELILPLVFMYMFLLGIWNYWFRPKFPPHMNVQISQADNVLPDELAEEFDTFPTSSSVELVKRRYDNLRTVAGRIQTLVGDVATQAERIQGLISWRDPRATMLFMLFCLVAALVLYFTPMQLLVLVSGLCVMRHPRLRGRTPSVPLNFFRRLPARTDSML